MRPRHSLSIAFFLLAVAATHSSGEEGYRTVGRRRVLVELYTSQGCNMCPTAEKFLGTLAEKNPGIVPIAFHVDYFNDPWKDVFSDPLYSRRQMIYDQLYTKPKNPDYGLFYTPMLMIDGVESVNGVIPASAAEAIRMCLPENPPSPSPSPSS